MNIRVAGLGHGQRLASDGQRGRPGGRGRIGRHRNSDGPVAGAARARVTVSQVEASRGRPRATGRRGDGDVLAPRRPTELPRSARR